MHVTMIYIKTKNEDKGNDEGATRTQKTGTQFKCIFVTFAMTTNRNQIRHFLGISSFLNYPSCP